MLRLSLLVSFLIGASASTAAADRVVLLPVQGPGDDAEKADVEEAIANAIRGLGHEPISTREAWMPTAGEIPESIEGFRAVATERSAEWVVAAEVSPGDEGYAMRIRAANAPRGRVEVLDVEIRRAREQARLRDILGAMLRPEGLDDDALRLVTDPDPRDEADDAAREQRAREEFLARERAREEEARARDQERWEARERYGSQGPWMAQLGLGLRPILLHPARADGGVLSAIELRAGRAVLAVPGLEVRAGVDVMFGAATALTFYGGAVYLAAPWADAPVFLGGGAELGLFQSVTGSRVGQFMVRGGPVVAWHIKNGFLLEGSLPEVMVLSAGGGALTLGLSFRLAKRF